MVELRRPYKAYVALYRESLQPLLQRPRALLISGNGRGACPDSAGMDCFYGDSTSLEQSLKE